jgi:alpha-N-acetylglucosaminidase
VEKKMQLLLNLLPLSALLLLSAVSPFSVSYSYAAAAAPASDESRLKNMGSVEAVEAMVQRIFAGAAATGDSAEEFVSPFEFSLLAWGKSCGGRSHAAAPPCFSITDGSTVGTIAIAGTTASELGAGLGFYLREVANMTIGWRRGGGSNIYVPSAASGAAAWPAIGAGTTVVRRRNTPWSYFMNVCTHSYSLVWYSWDDWSHFLDWMSLSGINLFLAMTGQEEVQYKVFQKLGLKDLDIRKWFNGPALLTWSRGQNEYGSNIAGPLPRSWMQGQWKLQKQILDRSRSLGMSGQLPGFQGNVPIALKDILRDSNITDNKLGTGWMDALDPEYGKIADMWMAELVEDFGTDHWWQLDGYFNGGTAPWLANKGWGSGELSRTPASDEQQLPFVLDALPDFPDWKARGTQAYTGLNRTDPEAIWSFQGWAFVGWKTQQQASSLKSFVDATPKGKFNVIDMSVNGKGEWKMWNNASFWGANFVWTTLHDFGGTDGMKGSLSRINQIPFGTPVGSRVWGTGFTPEGIDQNPVYYEFMSDVNWREAPVDDIPADISLRSHRRYGLNDGLNAHVDSAWRSLVASSYSQDLSVQDGTGVAHIGSNEEWAWLQDRYTPSDTLCMVWRAWGDLNAAANAVSPSNEPFRYDLINLGREILAQIAGPFGQNFTDTVPVNASLDAEAIARTGAAYAEVLEDLDTLVATDAAFLLGPWIEMAKDFAKAYGAEDCTHTGYETITDCAKFYEWNARVQLTTWNPTPKGAAAVPDGPIDYASKHWSGLVKDYYGERVKRLAKAAAVEAAAGRTWTTAKREALEASLAYEWTTATNLYPTKPVGNAFAMSQAMHAKYAPHFVSCEEQR